MNNNEKHPAIWPGMIVAGVEIKSALNAKRIRVLSRRKNGLFTECPERDGIAGLESLLYCLSLTSDDLSDTFRLTQDEWDEAVEEFAMKLPDGGLEEFAGLFDAEQEAIANVSVKPEGEDEEDLGKTQDSETLAQSPTGSLRCLPRDAAQGSTTQPPNPSPSSTSCSTSTLSDTQTAQGSTGSGGNQATG